MKRNMFIAIAILTVCFVIQAANIGYYYNRSFVTLDFHMDKIFCRCEDQNKLNSVLTILAGYDYQYSLFDEPDLYLFEFSQPLDDTDFKSIYNDLRDEVPTYLYFTYSDKILPVLDEILLMKKDGVTEQELETIIQQYELNLLEVDDCPPQGIYRYQSSSDEPLYPLNLCKEFMENYPAVFTWVEPNYLEKTKFNFTPYDPMYMNGEQCYLDESETGMETAWGIIEDLPNQGISIGIFDSGVDYFGEPGVGHEDLRVNYWGDYLDCDPNGDGRPVYGTADDFHGTKVCGVAAADTSETPEGAIGIASVGFHSKFVPIKRSECGSGGDYMERSDFMNFFCDAADMGIHVINCSWGEIGNPSHAHESKIRYAHETGRDGKGCIVVCSSGNDGEPQINALASYWECIAVGNSICELGDRVSNSNYSRALDIIAPGRRYQDQYMTTTLNNNYAEFSGTSAAAPVVSGVSALILTMSFDQMTTCEVKSVLEFTATDGEGDPDEDTLGFDRYMGWGRVNAGLALQFLDQYPDGIPPDFEPLRLDETKVLNFPRSTWLDVELSPSNYNGYYFLDRIGHVFNSGEAKEHCESADSGPDRVDIEVIGDDRGYFTLRKDGTVEYWSWEFPNQHFHGDFAVTENVEAIKMALHCPDPSDPTTSCYFVLYQDFENDEYKVKKFYYPENSDIVGPGEDGDPIPMIYCTDIECKDDNTLYVLNESGYLMKNVNDGIWIDSTDEDYPAIEYSGAEDYAWIDFELDPDGLGAWFLGAWGADWAPTKSAFYRNYNTPLIPRASGTFLDSRLPCGQQYHDFEVFPMYHNRAFVFLYGGWSENTYDGIPLFTTIKFVVHVYLSVHQGSDLNGDGSLENPWQTIQHAVASTNTIEADEDFGLIFHLEEGDYLIDENYPVEVRLREYVTIEGDGSNTSIYTDSPSQIPIYLESNSTMKKLTINTGIIIEGTDNALENLEVTNDNDTAIQFEMYSGATLNNILIHDSTTGVSLKDKANAEINGCTIADNSEDGIVCGPSSNCTINNSNICFNSNYGIKSEKNANVTANHCNISENGRDTNGDINQISCISENPLFVDSQNDDYHLIQTTVYKIIPAEETSPCVDAGDSATDPEGSTRIDNAPDADVVDIGYHYPSETFRYVVPRFDEEDETYVDRSAEISLQNPNEYETNVTYKYYNLSGAQQGDLVDVVIDPHATYVFDDVPDIKGSIEIEADAPIFGHCRNQEYFTLFDTRNSFMTQIQRVSMASSDMSSTSLMVGNWWSHYGGSAVEADTEFIIKNMHDVEVTISAGKIFHHDGTEMMQLLSDYTLDPHEVYTFEAGQYFTNLWGSFEVNASMPLVGEVIFRNNNGDTDTPFADAIIMIPESMYSNELYAPFVYLFDFGGSKWEDWIIMKNPLDQDVSINIDLFHEDGSEFNPQPYPDPVIIVAKGMFGISSWEAFPDDDFGTAKITVDGDGLIIGHNEVLGYFPIDPSYGDMAMAGCELDHRFSNATRYYAPYSYAVNTPDYFEQSWVIIKNIAATTNEITFRCYDFDGNLVDGPVVVYANPGELKFFPTTCELGEPEKLYSIEIESDEPISGWVDRWWQNKNIIDNSYDSNILQYW